MMAWMSLWMFVVLVVFVAAVATAVYVVLRLTRPDEDPQKGVKDLPDQR